MADESFRGVATEIALWQGAALELPLDQVQDMVTASQRGLAEILNHFNKVYLADADGGALGDLIAEVARRATATAIFTLGVTQRTHQIAHHN